MCFLDTFAVTNLLRCGARFADMNGMVTRLSFLTKKHVDVRNALVTHLCLRLNFYKGWPRTLMVSSIVVDILTRKRKCKCGVHNVGMSGMRPRQPCSAAADAHAVQGLVGKPQLLRT